jgi:hypothetical protein
MGSNPHRSIEAEGGEIPLHGSRSALTCQSARDFQNHPMLQVTWRLGTEEGGVMWPGLVRRQGGSNGPVSYLVRPPRGGWLHRRPRLRAACMLTAPLASLTPYKTSCFAEVW